jgi:hypothetical protein
MASQFVILSVVKISPKAKRYGLHLNDHLIQGVSQCKELFIVLNGQEISLAKSINAYRNHGRLTNRVINTWINQNHLHLWPSPIKLIFRLNRRLTEHKFELYALQANCLNHFIA